MTANQSAAETKPDELRYTKTKTLATEKKASASSSISSSDTLRTVKTYRTQGMLTVRYSPLIKQSVADNPTSK